MSVGSPTLRREQAILVFCQVNQDDDEEPHYSTVTGKLHSAPSRSEPLGQVQADSSERALVTTGSTALTVLVKSACGSCMFRARSIICWATFILHAL